MSDNRMEEILLCNLAASGDMVAMETLYIRYYDLLLNFGLKYYNDRAFVKDCIQDLFVKFILRPSALKGVRYIRTFLLVSLKNIIYDRMHGTVSHDQLDDLSFIDIIDNISFSEGMQEDDVQEEKEKLRRLSNAIVQLTANQRTAIYLRYVKGLSHKEVSEYLNMNEQSSRNLLSRALKKLRDIVKNGLPMLF